MHLQLRFKRTYILLQENNNTNHGSSSKISTHNPTSQIKKKKKNHSKSSTHNPTSQILKKITAKTNHA